MEKINYKLVTSEQELKEALAVRREVFIEEQGIPLEIELDEHDQEALHMVVEDGKRVIGTARIQFLTPLQAKIERMAVLKSFRRQGIGSGMISLLNDELKKRKIAEIVLHAQYPVVPFYRSRGFRETGAPFLEAGIKHRKMQRQL